MTSGGKRYLAKAELGAGWGLGSACDLIAGVSPDGRPCAQCNSALRTENGVQLSYRWRRWWVRLMSLGKLEAPRPSFSDQTAKRLMVVVGIVVIVVGVGLLVGSVVSLST
jgi:hypothetical protein